MITDARMEKSLIYLAETDKAIAEAKGNVARAEYLLKRKEAIAFLSAKGNNVRERESAAKLDLDVEQANEDMTTALVAYEELRAKRATEEIVIEVWRSQESSRRAGA